MTPDTKTASSHASRTPQYYLITKDELEEVFSFVQHAPEFTQDIEGEVLKRPYTSASSDVLDSVDHLLNEELKDCINRGDEEAVLIGDFICMFADKVLELRQQTKEREHP
jgi:hypothetical protein